MRTVSCAIARRTIAATLCIAFTTGTAFGQAPAPAPAPDGAAAATKKPLSETLTGTAKAEYEAGKLLYADGDFGAAIVKLQHAWELSKDVRLLWNMAACEKNLRHYARVLRLVQQYVAEGASFLTEQDRKDATDLVNTIKSFVSTLRVDVDEPGATVTVDNEVVGTSPLAEPVLVDIGQRRVRISKAGFKEVTQTVQADGSSEEKVSVKLEKDLHQGRVIITTGGPKDTILLDGQPVGEGHYEGVVPSGGHTLRITAPGMRAYQSEITVQDNEARNIQITLDAEKSGGVPTWVWITAGSVLVTGAAVGGYFAFRSKDETLPATAGTLGIVQMPLIRR